MGRYDPLGSILLRHKPTVNTGSGNRVLKAVVGLFLGLNNILVAFFCSISHIENIDIDVLDLQPIQILTPPQFKPEGVSLRSQGPTCSDPGSCHSQGFPLSSFFPRPLPRLLGRSFERWTVNSIRHSGQDRRRYRYVLADG